MPVRASNFVALKTKTKTKPSFTEMKFICHTIHKAKVYISVVIHTFKIYATIITVNFGMFSSPRKEFQ